MSRTIRRKNVTYEYYWVLRDWVISRGFMGYSMHNPKSIEGKKALNRFHSDAGTHQMREPGPAWFRNVTSQRPLRRHGREQLRKFMLDEEFEVIIEENPYLEYWT